MAETRFLEGSANITANTTINIISYKVQVPLSLFIQQVSIDLSPANYFPNITFSLLINGVANKNFQNINSQITQSYFPLSLPTPIKCEQGSLVVWQIVGLSSLGSNTAAAYASILGILK